MAENLPEAWLRGPIPGVDTLLAPLLHSFQMAREDLAQWTDGLTSRQIWATPNGFGSVGFHLRHIAASTDRLMTYVQGKPLSETQMAALNAAFDNAEAVVRSLDPAQLAEPRAVGRKQLPTTVIGLLFHIAEHTQRHTGQAISAAKWTRVG